jgi:hypothetical protein
VDQEGGGKVKNKFGKNAGMTGIFDGENNNPRTMAKRTGEQ